MVSGCNEDIDCEVTLSEENMNIAKKEGLENKFKLTSTIGTANMHLLDSDGNVQKYDTPEESMYLLLSIWLYTPLFASSWKCSILQYLKSSLKRGWKSMRKERSMQYLYFL